MFAQFLDIVFRSLKLDRNLYKDQRYFGEAAIYFAGLAIINNFSEYIIVILN